MAQIHRRFAGVQVRFLLEAYLKGNMSRTEIQGSLEIGKTRFFALLKEYRRDHEGFEVSYHRRSSGKLTQAAEAEIRRELLREKKLVEDSRLPISGYNLSAARHAIPPCAIVWRKGGSMSLRQQSRREPRPWTATDLGPKGKSTTARF